MKNILLCNDSLGIGGVETVICNQVMAFTKKGYNVYVLAGNGIYAERIEEFGGKYIEMNFPETNQIDDKKINQIIKIIMKYNINEIHIHKYQCIPYVMPAALIANVPYLAYEHIIKTSMPYYTWNYPIYNNLFEIYFKNAYKILAITPETVKSTQVKFNINSDKYIIAHNGINFDRYINDENKNEGKNIKWLMVSAFRNEKIKSINNGIDLFNEYVKKVDKDATLDIIGGGEGLKEIERYIKNIGLENKINILGEKNNLEKYISKYDILLGVDRCILEAIAMKTPAVIIGYEELKGLVTKENIDLAIEENFSGNNMPSMTQEECIEQIENMLKNKNEMIEEIYIIAKEKLDAEKNYYTIPEERDIEENKFDWINLFKIIERNANENLKLSKENREKWDYIQLADKKIEEMAEETISLKDELIKVKKQKEEFEIKYISIKEEINQIYNSKRWKYIDKIDKFLGRKK